MRWLGRVDPNGALFDPLGLPGGDRIGMVAGKLMPRGTLLIEAELPAGRDPVIVLDHNVTALWRSGLRIETTPDGCLHITQRQEDRQRRFTLATSLSGQAAQIRLMFGWDGPGQRATLSLDIAETGAHHYAVLPAPLPLSLDDAAALCRAGGRTLGGAHLQSLAVADDVLPIGPLPTLDGQTPIATPSGLRPISSLRAGQQVVLPDGQFAQVRWCGAVDLPTMGRLAPVTLRAPFFGAMRDLTCAPEQRLLMRSCEVEYLFATDAVAALVGDLGSGTVPVRDAAPVTRYWQVVLDRAVPLRVGGLDLEGLDARRLADDPTLHAHSILRDLPRELLPVSRGVPPVLRDFETRTLCQLRAA